MPFGNNGLCRYWSLHRPTDIFEFGDRIARNDMESLPAAQQSALEQCGEQEVARRIEGITNNLGASYAFREKRSSTLGSKYTPCICLLVNNVITVNQAG